MELISLTLAAALSAGISFAGVAARALTPLAGLFAFLIGLSVIAGTGWAGALALGAFFVSSSAVSRLTERSQPAWVDAKANRRDPWQVLANGAMAGVGGAVGILVHPSLGMWIAVPALAAAGADTWATSIGMLSRRDPIHLVERRRVPKGTSGGVSLIGTAGGVAGSVLVASSPLLAGAPLALARFAVLIGAVGMVADSFLGATVQGRFECPACGQPSERRRHRCGMPTRHVGGVRWLGNDGVNLLATVLAGLAGWAWWLVCCSG